MMRHAGAIRRARLGRPDIHPAVDLARVGVDDFRVQTLGQRRSRQPVLPTPVGPTIKPTRIVSAASVAGAPARPSFPPKPGPVSLVGELCVTSENLSRDPIATRAETWKISQRLQLPKKNTR